MLLVKSLLNPMECSVLNEPASAGMSQARVSFITSHLGCTNHRASPQIDPDKSWPPVCTENFICRPADLFLDLNLFPWHGSWLLSPGACTLKREPASAMHHLQQLIALWQFVALAPFQLLNLSLWPTYLYYSWWSKSLILSFAASPKEMCHEKVLLH